MSIVVLSSKDLSEGTTHDGIITLLQPLEGSYRLSEVVLMNTIYSVNSKNDQIYFVEGGAPFVGSLTNGTYTSTELALEIKSAMEAVGGVTYTIVYNQNTHTYDFDGTANFGFTFSSFGTNTARFLLGKDNVDDVEGLSQESEGCIDLNPHKIIYFNFPAGVSQLQTSGNIQSTFHLSTWGDFGDTIRQSYSDVVLSFASKTQIAYKVHDREGNVIDLNGGEWEIVLVKV